MSTAFSDESDGPGHEASVVELPRLDPPPDLTLYLDANLLAFVLNRHLPPTFFLSYSLCDLTSLPL